MEHKYKTKAGTEVRFFDGGGHIIFWDRDKEGICSYCNTVTASAVDGELRWLCNVCHGGSAKLSEVPND